MKKSIKKWMKKLGCTILATAVLVCSIPTQVYVYPGQVAYADDGMGEGESSSITSEESSSVESSATGSSVTESKGESGENTPGEGNEGESGDNIPGAGSEGESGDNTPEDGGEGESGDNTPEDGGEGESGDNTPEDGSEGEPEEVEPSVVITSVQPTITYGNKSFVDNAYNMQCEVSVVVEYDAENCENADIEKALLDNYKVALTVSGTNGFETTDCGTKSLGAAIDESTGKITLNYGAVTVYENGTNLTAKATLIKEGEDNKEYSASKVVNLPSITITGISLSCKEEDRYLVQGHYQAEYSVRAEVAYNIEHCENETEENNLLNVCSVNLVATDSNDVQLVESTRTLAGAKGGKAVLYSKKFVCKEDTVLTAKATSAYGASGTEYAGTKTVNLPKIKVNVQQPVIQLEENGKVHENGQYVFNYIAKAGVTYTIENTEDNEEKNKLINDCIIKLRVEDASGTTKGFCELPLSEINNNEIITESFGCASDTTLTATATLVTGAGAYDAPEQTKEVKLPKLTINSITTSVATLGDSYVDAELCYETKYQVNAKVSYTATDCTEDEEKALLGDYSVQLFKNGEKCTELVALQKTGNGEAVLSSTEYSTKDSMSVATEALLKHCTQENGSVYQGSKSVETVNVPKLAITNIVPSLQFVEKYYNAEDGWYTSVYKVSADLTYSAENCDENEEDKLLSNYSVKLIAVEGMNNQRVNTEVSLADISGGKGTLVSRTFDCISDADMTLKAVLVQGGKEVATYTNSGNVSIPDVTVVASANPTFGAHSYELVDNEDVHNEYVYHVPVSAAVTVSDISEIAADNTLQELMKKYSITFEAVNSAGTALVPTQSKNGLDYDENGIISFNADLTVAADTDVTITLKVVDNRGTTVVNESITKQVRIPRIDIKSVTPYVTTKEYVRIGDIYADRVNVITDVTYQVVNCPAEEVDKTSYDAAMYLLNNCEVVLGLYNGTEELREPVSFKGLATDAIGQVNTIRREYTYDITSDMTVKAQAKVIECKAEGALMDTITDGTSVALDVKLPYITVETPVVEITPEYRYDAVEDEQHYDVTITAYANYTIHNNAGEANGALYSAVTELLKDYKLEILAKEGENSIYYVANETEWKFSRDDNGCAIKTWTIDLSGKDIETTNVSVTANVYHNKATDTGLAWTLLTSASDEKNITVPENITLSSTQYPKVAITHAISCIFNHGWFHRVDKHVMEVTGKVRLDISDMAGLSETQRKDEITRRVNNSKLVVYQNHWFKEDEMCLEIPFTADNMTYEVIEGEDGKWYIEVSLKTGEDVATFERREAGAHKYYTKVVINNQGKAYEESEIDSPIEYLEQNFDFAPSDGDGIVKYAEELRYELTGEDLICVGDLACYELDADGNRLEESNVEFSVENNVVTINTKKLGTYTLEFEYPGDVIYQAKTVQKTFTVEKAPVYSELIVNGATEQTSYVKTHNLEFVVNMRADISSAFGEYLTALEDNFVVSFVAVPKDSGYDTVEFDSKEIVFDSKKGYATVTTQITKAQSEKLSEKTDYTIKAVITCGTDFPYVTDNGLITLTSDSFGVDNINLILQDNAHEMQYGEEFTLTPVFLESQNDEQVSEYPLTLSYKSLNEDVATIDETGKLTVLTKGTVTIEVTADDADNATLDMYNETTQNYTVTIVSPEYTTVNLTVNEASYTDVEADKLYAAADAVVSDVRWYDESIIVTIPSDSEYNNICYSNDGGTSWENAGTEWTINNDLAKDYIYYLNNETAKISSLDASADNGVYKRLDNIAVDTTNPALEDVIVLTSDVTKSDYSDKTIEYFSKAVGLTVYADDKIAEAYGKSETALLDYQSGVQMIQVYYQNEQTQNEWVEVIKNTYVDDNSYFAQYSFDFNHTDYNHSAVMVKVTDHLNHSTEVIFTGTLENNAPNYDATDAVKICVDELYPVLTVDGHNTKTPEVTYEGNWTNDQLEFLLDVTNLSDLESGIQSYEYAFVNVGESLENTEWEVIDEDELKVLIGMQKDAFVDEKQKAEAIVGTGNVATVDEETVTEDGEAARQNGVAYFRVTTKAGLERVIEMPVKIWQAQLDAPEVYVDKEVLENGWYNASSEDVTWSFAYPDDYKSDSNAPVISTYYELDREYENASEPTRSYQFTNAGIDYDNEKIHSEASILIDEDSINTLRVWVEDEAGNRTNTYEYEIKADFTIPSIDRISYNGISQDLYTSGRTEDIVYTVFTQGSVSVTTAVEYGISQKDSLKLQQCKAVSDWTANGGVETESITIAANARGFIYAKAIDGAGNEAVKWADGYVADNKKPNGSDGSGITIVAPRPNAAEFYNGDIPLKISVSDANGGDYAGLKSVTYSISRDGQNTVSGQSLLTFPSSTPTWSQISQYASLDTEEVVIDAERNEGNEVKIYVTAVDNAMNQTVTEKIYKIDITKPVINVSFDAAEAVNGTYYNKARVARITINEKNFEPSRVKFTIYKDGVEVSNLTPANWTTDGNNHIAVITFAEDGDYSFSVGCTDLADNAAEQVTVDEFTVDVTDPVVEVTYDQDTPWSDNYFSSTRTATITVIEHNFNEADFVATVEPYVAMSNWTHNGDTHRATISFTQDGYYTLMVNYADMAGNVMVPFAEQDFYIDTQVPELSISGVENNSANAGTVIPVVHATDGNYDVAGMDITLTDSTGAAYDVETVVSAQLNGYQYTLTNVDTLDDQIYTLRAAVTDRAGNSSEISYRFSLNRNGSTYDLQEINSLVEKSYLRFADMEDLHITEMNVDRIENFSIYLNKGGEVLTKSQAGPLPSVREADVIYYDVEILGNDETGYEYIYTLYRENFESEGIYNLMFYSKDRAGNEVNNTLTEKGAEITFVVDNTAPTVVVDGVEAGEFYAEEYRDVNVYVSDYTQLVEAFFYLVDEDGQTIETYNYLELAAEAGDVVTLRIPGNDKGLYLNYSAKDISGNEITSISIDDEAAPTSFMITTNTWLQIRNNETALTTIIIGGIVVVILIPVSVLYFKRRRIGK